MINSVDNTVLEIEHRRRLENEDRQIDDEFMEGLITSEKESKPPEKEQGGIVQDVSRGLIELPLQTIGGVIDGIFNDTSDLIYDLSSWVNNYHDLGQVTWDENKGLHWAEGMPSKNPLQVPTVPPAETVTGGIIREMSNFMSLFLGVGKLQAFKALQTQTKTGKVSKPLLQGFIADFVNKPETNLSNIIQKYPSLENPINEWLSCEQDCDEMDKRLRTGLEGIGVGVVADGLIKGLSLLKTARKTKDEAIKNGIFPESVLTKQSIDDAVSMKGLEDVLPTKGKGIEVNWSKVNADEDIKKLMAQMVEKNQSNLNKATRGTRSWQQTVLSAQQKNAWQILEELKQRGKGATLNAEETVALRELWVKSGEKLNQLATRAAVDANNNIQVQFQKMLAIHRAIQEKVIGVRTETARALNAWKIPAGSNMETMAHMDNLMDSVGGNISSQTLAQKYLQLGDNAAAKVTFIKGSMWATTSEATKQLWYFSLLSGPHTHARNFLSNALTTLNDVAERKVASYLGDAVAPDEARLKMYGMVAGFKDAFRLTSRGRKALLQQVRGKKKPSQDELDSMGTLPRFLSTGKSAFSGSSKVEHNSKGHLSELTNQAFEQVSSKMPDQSAIHAAIGILNTGMQLPMKAMDKVTMLPHQALNFVDEMWKTVNYRSELTAQAGAKAWAMARNGEISKDDISGLIVDLVNDPDEFMRLRSNEKADLLSFTGRPPPDSKIWQSIRSTGQLPIVGRIIMPFTRVVYNIGAYTFERTPMAPMVKRWRDDMAQGGRSRQMALAKMGLGSMALTSAVDLSMRGAITGTGSPELGERATDRRTGVQANSVKIGDRYFSYRGMEPLAAPLGIAANLTEILAHSAEEENTQVDEMVIAASLAIGNQIVSQQYMMGIANLFDAMSDPTRKGERWFNSLAAAMVPAGVAQFNRSLVDAELHQVENMLDAYRSRIPGLSQSVPYRIDLWGRRMSIRSGLGQVYDTLSPFYSKEYKPEPIDLELKRLGYYPQGLNRKLSFNGVNVDMERYPRAWERLKVLAGNEATTTALGVPIDPITNKGAMDTLNLIAQGKHPGYPIYSLLTDGSDGGKAQLIQKVISDFRRAAKEHILKEFPEIAQEVREKEQFMYKFLESN
ncbi:MAG: hypothetical protein LPH21_12580 [Shewanella sp.]|nr:hypothetical protein [Shewanella sp.]